MKDKKIVIKAPKVVNGKNLMFKLECSKDVSRFFPCKKLILEYPVDISCLDLSIQTVPALASVIGVAWIIGADVYVKSVDKNFRESLEKIRLVMKRWYPNLNFSSEIFGELKNNSYSGSNFGLLYSAGLDSTTSYIKHRKKGLVLISVSGEGGSIDSQFKDKQFITPLSSQEERIFTIRTNIENVVDEQLIYEKFGLNWWMNLSHGLVLTGHCAPLTVVKDVGVLYLASSFTRDFNFPWGSHPSIDNNICWGNTRVVHDGFDTTRQEKVLNILKAYGEEFGEYPTLKVCSKFSRLGSNCCKCEKCSRTIIGLLAAGIDPKKCGFNIDAQNVGYIKKSLERGVFFSKKGLIERPVKMINRIYPIFEWEDIQQNLPSEFKEDEYGSESFFEWFKSFDVKERANKIGLVDFPKLFLYSIFDLLAPISFIFPSKMQNMLRASFDYFFKNKK
ncbi:MAG: hypothetical protein QCH99_08320 [Candidatus Bathyarchaeota archaeon]|nr:hypothetical protein [Candidatus Bathyarchaeum tardum]